MAQEPIVLSEIKNREDLKKILNFLDNQGFYINESESSLHNDKVRKIIYRANKLNLKLENDEVTKIFTNLSKYENYTDMIKVAEEYFSKYSPEDKIKEFIKEFYIQSDEDIRVASRNSPGPKEVVEWFNFRTKHGLKDEYYGSISYYDLDKKFFKIRFPDYKNDDFKKLYELIFGEKCKDFVKTMFSDNKYGEWQDVGKIEIKFFKSGATNIKGDLTTFKKYYYQYLTDRVYGTYIIKYNGKKEIFKKSNNE